MLVPLSLLEHKRQLCKRCCSEGLRTKNAKRARQPTTCRVRANWCSDRSGSNVRTHVRRKTNGNVQPRNFGPGDAVAVAICLYCSRSTVSVGFFRRLDSLVVLPSAPHAQGGYLQLGDDTVLSCRRPKAVRLLRRKLEGCAQDGSEARD